MLTHVSAAGGCAGGPWAAVLKIATGNNNPDTELTHHIDNYLIIDSGGDTLPAELFNDYLKGIMQIRYLDAGGLNSDNLQFIRTYE